jgi:hypothetical protein
MASYPQGLRHFDAGSRQSTNLWSFKLKALRAAWRHACIKTAGNKPACIKTACGTKTMVKDFETDGLAASWRRRLTFGAQ